MFFYTVNNLKKVNPMPLSYIVVFLSLLLPLSATVSANEYQLIKWVDLIPAADLDILLNPPEAINAIPHGSETGAFDQLSNAIDKGIEQSKTLPSPEEQAYSAALASTNVNVEYHQKNIRLAGFIVPVEYSDTQVITEFFLVPYFGACIHVPPPPPNQIIYVKYPKGLKLTALYDPFWIEGQLATEVIKNDIATSAYRLSADSIKPYEEYKK
jgi:hypothetical protein